jgi:hypothetical protein
MAKAEWKPKRLNELGFVGRGKSRHRPRNDARLYGGQYPFIQTADIMTVDQQRGIGPFLSAYDDLIENCQRRIKILEQMARGLYREWFVNFRFPNHAKTPMVDSPLGKIPKGREVKLMTECVHINASVKVPRDGEKPFVPMGASRMIQCSFLTLKLVKATAVQNSKTKTRSSPESRPAWRTERRGMFSFCQMRMLWHLVRRSYRGTRPCAERTNPGRPGPTALALVNVRLVVESIAACLR